MKDTQHRAIRTYLAYARAKEGTGLTNRDICRLTGIAPSTMTEWSRGRYTPKADKMMAIAQILNVPLETLIDPPPRRRQINQINHN